jgi:Arc/MetJ-type ribon-helix-helix transcriptional regulator
LKVWGEVPDSWDEKIRKAMRIEGWDTVSAYVRDLIREDLKRKGLLGVRNGEEKEAVVVEG